MQEQASRWHQQWQAAEQQRQQVAWELDRFRTGSVTRETVEEMLRKQERVHQVVVDNLQAQLRSMLQENQRLQSRIQELERYQQRLSGTGKRVACEDGAGATV